MVSIISTKFNCFHRHKLPFLPKVHLKLQSDLDPLFCLIHSHSLSDTSHLLHQPVQMCSGLVTSTMMGQGLEESLLVREVPVIDINNNVDLICHWQTVQKNFVLSNKLAFYSDRYHCPTTVSVTTRFLSYT